MCLTGLALGAGALGSFVDHREQVNNARRIQKAGERATLDNLAKSDQFANDAQQLFQPQVQNFNAENQEKNRQETTEELTEQFQSNVDGFDYSGAVGSTPKNVLIAAERESQKSKDKGNERAERFANLSSWGNQQFDNQQSLQGLGSQLGFIQDQAQGNARLLPIQQAAARNNAYRPNSGLGSLLQLGGLYGAIAAPHLSFGKAVQQGPGAYTALAFR